MKRFLNKRFFSKKYYVFITVLLSACGGGSSDQTPFLDSLNWTPGVYFPSSSYNNICNNIQAEKLFIRSVFNEYYLWYQDSQDLDPSSFNSLSTYFYSLLSNEITPSGKFKDEFSFITDASLFFDAVTEGIEIGYGMRYVIEENTSNDISSVTVAFVVPGSPAALAGIQRGDSITGINNSFLPTDSSNFLDGLFPFQAGETHNFYINNQSISTPLTSDRVAMPATDKEKIISVGGYNVAYLQFNDHTEISESELISVFDYFESVNIDQLVLDLRYNTGGYRYIANQVAYMIAGASNTFNKTFGTIYYNDRFFPDVENFISTSQDPIAINLITGRNDVSSISLPTLNLNKVYIITGADTCSASELIINSLRGIDIEVILIGETTCGKPYGFSGFENCGVGYFPIESRSSNHKGFGSYADGFKPSNDFTNAYAVSVPGCSVNDDFSRQMGDINEERLNAALYHIQNNSCPPQSLPQQGQIRGATQNGETRNRNQRTRGLLTPAEIKRRYGLDLTHESK